MSEYDEDAVTLGEVVGGGDVQAAIDAGTALGHPHPLDGTGRLHAVLVPAGADVKVLDAETLTEWSREHPRRKVGAFTLRTAASLVEYCARHATGATEVWADRERLAVLAVIDGHAPELAGHQEHIARLALRKTPAWEAWAALDGKLVRQEEFIDHVEARLPDFVEPTAAEFLEIVSTFKSLRKVDFEAGYRSSSGETTLEYRETQTSTAGKKGDLAIPERFEIGLIPFDGAVAYRVTARLRWRIDAGRLALGFILDRPDDVLDIAFADVVMLLDEEIEPPIWHGWPAGRL